MSVWSASMNMSVSYMCAPAAPPAAALHRTQTHTHTHTRTPCARTGWLAGAPRLAVRSPRRVQPLGRGK
jgi:hypothetical protein